jgi:hypothetical protein
MRWSLVGLLVFPFAAVAQSPLLSRIAIAVRDQMERLPNYTCTMTVDRRQRVTGSKGFQVIDKIRLEVALVDNHELYAWPGSHRFEEVPIYDMVGGGVIGTGEYGLFLQTVFLSGAATFRFAGQEELNDRQAYRFLYEVPRALSRYEIRLPTIRDTVGFGGSAWIDAASLEVLRLEVLVREIPAHLPLAFGRIAIDYGRLHTSRGGFLLPSSAEQNFAGGGQEALNQIAFSGCREYRAESAISFGETPKAMASPPVTLRPLEVPAGIEIESKLETQLDSGSVATGDPFEATVTKTVIRKGAVVVPKGATIHGRVDGVVRRAQPDACIGVILHPAWIDFKGREGAFAADQVSLPYLNPSRLAHDPCSFVREPGSAILQFNESTSRIPGGQLILWRTSKPDERR